MIQNISLVKKMVEHNDLDVRKCRFTSYEIPYI